MLPPSNFVTVHVGFRICTEPSILGLRKGYHLGDNESPPSPGAASTSQKGCCGARSIASATATTITMRC
jgi:hypothetical protein